MSGKGKKGKGKGKGNEVAQKTYALISLEEVHTREQKYYTRLTALNACLTYIYDAIEKVHHLTQLRNILEEWNTYLRCDGLPKPYIPPDIRLFFSKLRYFEDEQVQKTMDWQLSIDERSILSQNIFRKDCTRQTLIKEIRPNFGDEYSKDVDLALKVLKAITYFLDDDERDTKASSSVLVDIAEQKHEVQVAISELFNRFTYRILCAEDAYMESVDGRTAEYYYDGNNFQIHIWTLINVPILFRFLEEPYLIADLHQINLKLQLPFSILQENLTLRAVHMNFDHCSEHAKSYEQKIIQPKVPLNAGIQDLYECLINEWNTQVDIQMEVREKMKQKHLEYEEKMRVFEEDSKKKRKNEEDDKKKKVKMPKEPPNITAETFPDVWEDFLEMEQREFDNFINIVYHPNVLQLSEHEINLKKYFILGGIYELYLVEKPRHYNLGTFNMTWHANDGNLLINKDVVVDRDQLVVMPSYKSLRFSTISGASRASSHVLKSIKSTMSTVSVNDEFNPEKSPLFIMTFQLPRTLCLWGEPVPCQYETDVIQYIEDNEKDTAGEQSVSTSQRGGAHAASQDPVATPAAGPEGVVAADSSYALAGTPAMTRSQSTMSVSKIALNTLRTRHSMNIFHSSHSNLALIQKGNQANEAIQIDNFSLDFPLTKTQIRNVRRHCLPRMISSFNFPKELRDEETEDTRNKPKGKGGTLMRKRNSAEDATTASKVSDRLFTFLNQRNPERMFPIFATGERLELSYGHQFFDPTREMEPETFYELLDTLNYIKQKYRKRYENTANVPTWVPKVKLVKSHQKFMDAGRESEPEGSRRKLSSISRISKTSSYRRFRSSIGIITKFVKPEDASKRSTAAIQQEETDTLIEKEKSESEQSSETEEEVPTPPDTRKIIKYSHWTTEHILNSTFDRDRGMITIWTDRLGSIGFAYKRYEHFPFRYWSLEPSAEKPESEVIFTLETQYVKCVIIINSDGYRGYVTEPGKKFIRNRAMYLVIEEPLTDFKELKRLFRESNLNIFSDHDACFYIENGYFSEKHLAAELHTYSCMAMHSTQMRCASSDWNRLAKRRDIVLNFTHHIEPEENMLLVRITPEEATFVEIKELCSDNLDIIKLQYILTWRNIDYYADFHHLIHSVYPFATEQRVKEPNLLCCVKNLLCEIRPLSFS